MEEEKDADENSTRKEATESKHDGAKNVLRLVPSPPTNYEHINMVVWKGGEIVPRDVPAGEGTCGEVNMEASITTDDVIRAGGFGARDDINNFLPVASDSTDFEETILDARNYEEPQRETQRPGLGWRDSAERK
ncbi:hypothetical protein JCGZ_21130 [Jatropha curcas]|uniref:Uncharacterized protein n=1 Tax=Jatropha curcas TaxID=180498 RepID=A0A067JQC6_JATCU|nr:hypothetical protein JCGZ_21130 [Jatropha curcas]